MDIELEFPPAGRAYGAQAPDHPKFFKKKSKSV
jgi:hypothetical protein